LIENTDLETVLDGADSIIIITEKEGVVRLTFNQEMDEMEVLDILALVTSEFYEIAEEGKPTEH
tara:strand:+ start:493 stop:684 length:192 start_codon:yes stop_codon:yes gene_type:complete